MKIKKAQTAIEFVIMISLLLFFFVSMILIINYNLSDKYREKEEAVVKNIAYTIQDEINIASKTTNGYSREFTLPPNALGKDYEANIDYQDPSLVEVKTKRVSIVLPLPPDINVNETNAINIPGPNLIKKEQGEICLNVNPCPP